MKAKVGLVAAIVLLGLSFSTPAFAYGPNAETVTTSSSSVAPGGALTVAGSNFLPGGTVTIVLHSTPVTLGTTTADGTGSFSISVTIPLDADPGAHTITASDTAGDSVSTLVTVTGTVPLAASPSLAFTGADIAALSGVGAIAMALGGMLILTGRRRRRVAE